MFLQHTILYFKTFALKDIIIYTIFLRILVNNLKQFKKGSFKLIISKRKKNAALRLEKYKS